MAWKENYRIWMAFLNDYKNRGGRVTTGSDSGYIYKLYGFDYIRELELLREAGFHPLEVIRSATLYGAQALGLDKEIGSVEPGKLADLVVVEENPLQDLKVLYGTGAIRVTPDNKVDPRRRRQVHDQGRDRLRREEAPRRRAADRARRPRRRKGRGSCSRGCDLCSRPEGWNAWLAGRARPRAGQPGPRVKLVTDFLRQLEWQPLLRFAPAPGL